MKVPTRGAHIRAVADLQARETRSMPLGCLFAYMKVSPDLGSQPPPLIAT